MASRPTDASLINHYQEIGKFVVTFSQMEFWFKWRISDIFGPRRRQAQILLESMDVYKLVEAFERIVNDEEVLPDDPLSKRLVGVGGIEAQPECPVFNIGQKKKWNKILSSIRELNNKRVIIVHGAWLPGHATFDNSLSALVAKKTKRGGKKLEIESHFPSLASIQHATEMAEKIVADMSAI
jgi:hypothetical protein